MSDTASLADVRARARDEQTRKDWDAMKHALLALDVKDRPILKAGIDLSRQDLEAMPADVRAIVCGHLDLDSDLNDA